MIILCHKKGKVVSVWDEDTAKYIPFNQTNISSQLCLLAKENPNRLLIWCNEVYRRYLNVEKIKSLFLSKGVLMSYNLSKEPFLTDRIGYVNDSPFIKINKEVIYPTWLMSGDAGGIHASDLLNFKKINIDSNFNYFLNSIAKLGMSQGLFCYSCPGLLKTKDCSETITANTYLLFRFVKQHYKLAWVFLLFINILIYEKKIKALALMYSFFFKKRKAKLRINKPIAPIKSSITSELRLDVIIPTIGRKKYLYDVLKDLSKQTLMPKNVIVIEQNADFSTKSELDYLSSEEWPFNIKHEFINRTGACYARNRALKYVDSDWVFMADDDIRFEYNMLEIALREMCNYNLGAATLKCLRKGDKEVSLPVIQWGAFGSGCSIISSEIARRVSFDEAFEHGFGEDLDYGMQIRNLGKDIVYISSCSLLHLKAPIGGFRTKFINDWNNDKIQPKPAPTIMLFNLKHRTIRQVNGLRTLLFIKFYKKQKTKNIFSYYFQMKERWIKSQKLANTLKK